MKVSEFIRSSYKYNLSSKRGATQEDGTGYQLTEDLNDDQWTNKQRLAKREQVEVPGANTMDIARVIEALAALPNNT